MTSLILVIFLFLFLSWIRNLISHQFTAVSLLLTKNPTPAIIIYSLLFLPGTIIHELSHLFTASLLRVRTGKINILPSLNYQQRQIRLGSVQIEKTDFVRQTFIGAAPTIVGVVSLYLLVLLTFPQLFDSTRLTTITNQLIIIATSTYTPTKILSLYLIFNISSTMHTSPSDRESWPLFIFVALLIFLSLFFLGFEIKPDTLSTIYTITPVITASFILAIVLNLALSTLLWILIQILQIITGKRIISI